MGRIKALLTQFPENQMPRLAHRLFPLGFALIVTALVAGCQLSAPGTGAGPDTGVTPNAVAGDAIEVTALDAPPSASAPEAAGAVPAAAEGPAAGEGQAPDTGRKPSRRGSPG
ncbi:MAG: hypothetical protein HC783_12375 [Rhodobacteraceae bacterium]|nr:hypothetical protein [Paracoccaceae bacterium]